MTVDRLIGALESAPPSEFAERAGQLLEALAGEGLAIRHSPTLFQMTPAGRQRIASMRWVLRGRA